MAPWGTIILLVLVILSTLFTITFCSLLFGLWYHPSREVRSYLQFPIWLHVPSIASVVFKSLLLANLLYLRPMA